MKMTFLLLKSPPTIARTSAHVFWNPENTHAYYGWEFSLLLYWKIYFMILFIKIDYDKRIQETSHCRTMLRVADPKLIFR